MTVFKAPGYIKDLFNSIAYKYDFMNNIMSFGMHKKVKKACVKLLEISPHAKVLDACSGTGDMAYFVREIQPFAQVTGVDFSENMLSIAQNKLEGVELFQGDITSLDFDDNIFDFVIIAFGLRNISNPEKALNEIYRVLKPGGKFLHLDFGKKNIFGKFFEAATPIAAKIFYGNSEPYKYLIKSKRAFPEPDELICDFEKIGFKFETRKDFVLGTISAQVMRK